jgi:hypothetical protein
VTLALEGSGWSAPRPGRFTPGKDPVPIVQEAWWVPGPVWMGAENLAPTGVLFMYCTYRLVLLVLVLYCQESFCTVSTVIIIPSFISTWWISGILNK